MSTGRKEKRIYAPPPYFDPYAPLIIEPGQSTHEIALACIRYQEFAQQDDITFPNGATGILFKRKWDRSELLFVFHPDGSADSFVIIDGKDGCSCKSIPCFIQETLCICINHIAKASGRAPFTPPQYYPYKTGLKKSPFLPQKHCV